MMATLAREAVRVRVREGVALGWVEVAAADCSTTTRRVIEGAIATIVPRRSGGYLYRVSMAERSDHRRVVITGLGVVTPLGNTTAQMWQRMAEGRSGVAPLVTFPPVPGHVVYGGEARDFTGHIDEFGELPKDRKKAIRKALKMMCRETMMAVAAAQQAIGEAALADAAVDPERTGVVYGSDYMLSPPEDFLAGMKACGVEEDNFQYQRWGSTGLGEMNPLWMLKYLPNMPASHIGIFNDFRGPNNSLTMREISGAMAVREAAQTIVRGHAERMLAGACGTRIHPFKTIHAIQTEQLADVDRPPEEASRPFDRDRTGMVVGEGAAALLLEEASLAEARGAKIYVAGCPARFSSRTSDRSRPKTCNA